MSDKVRVFPKDGIVKMAGYWYQFVDGMPTICYTRKESAITKQDGLKVVFPQEVYSLAPRSHDELDFLDRRQSYDYVVHIEKEFPTEKIEERHYHFDGIESLLHKWDGPAHIETFNDGSVLKTYFLNGEKQGYEIFDKEGKKLDSKGKIFTKPSDLPVKQTAQPSDQNGLTALLCMATTLGLGVLAAKKSRRNKAEKQVATTEIISKVVKVDA